MIEGFVAIDMKSASPLKPPAPSPQKTRRFSRFYNNPICLIFDLERLFLQLIDPITKNQFNLS